MLWFLRWNGGLGIQKQNIKKQDKTMNKQFRTYNEYKKYMVEQGDVESDVIEKFIGMGLLMKVKVVSVEGYEVIGFRD